MNTETLIGLPMCDCATRDQLADILAALAEYPDASDDEISGVIGWPASLIAKVRAQNN